MYPSAGRALHTLGRKVWGGGHVPPVRPPGSAASGTGHIVSDILYRTYYTGHIILDTPIVSWLFVNIMRIDVYNNVTDTD